MEQMVLNCDSKKRVIVNKIQNAKKSNQLKIVTDLQTKFNKTLLCGLYDLPNLEVMELLISSKTTYNSIYQSQDIYCLFKSMRHLKNLYHLNISIDTINNLDDEGANELGKLIKSLNSLEQLKIKFKFRNYFNDENSLQKVIAALRKQTNLDILELSLDGQSGFGLNSIGDFKKTLESQSKLTHFKLDLKNIHISNRGFVELGKGLASLKQLVSLSLSFSECNLNDKNVGFIRCLENYQKLEYLSLDFNKLLPTQEFQGYLVYGLQQIFTLKEFYLKLLSDECDINPLKVIQSLQQNQHLQICEVTSPIKLLYDEVEDFVQQSDLSVLQLNLTFNKYYETGSLNFGRFLEQFTNLSTLELSLDTIDLKLCDVAKRLGKAINSLIQLVILKIIFKKNGQVDYGGAIGIGQAISKLENLECLNLQFEQNNLIGYIGAEIIGFSFQNLKKLVDLTLKIGDYNYIDKGGILGLKKGFQSMKNLESLSLFIGYGNGINSKQVKVLGEGLSNLTKLKNLSLNITSNMFQNCDMKSLADSFQSFQNLKHLSIILNGQVTTKSIVSFSKGLKNLNQLYSLDIKFKFEESEQQMILLFFQSIANIENLRILKLTLQEKINEMRFNQCIKHFKKSQISHIELKFRRISEYLSSVIEIKLQRILKCLVHYVVVDSCKPNEWSDEDDDGSDESDSQNSDTNSSLDSNQSLDSFQSSDEEF